MTSDVQDLAAETYFRHAHAEMLRFVRLDASRTFEVGCGAGAFGAVLQAHRQRARKSSAQPVGLELDPAAAESARSTFEIAGGSADAHETEFQVSAGLNNLFSGSLLKRGVAAD